MAIPVDLVSGRAVQNNGTPRGGQPPGLQPPVTPPYIGPSRDTRGGFLIAFDPATRSEGACKVAAAPAGVWSSRRAIRVPDRQ